MCNQVKPEGAPSCSAHGSAKLIDLLRAEIHKNGLDDSVQVTTCGSLGLCERGPNMVVYPEGVWYSGLTADNIPEIVGEHFQKGNIVERLANKDAAALKTEIEGNKKKMLAALKANDEAGVLPIDIMQQIRGFQASRVILSAVELDIFTAVGDRAGASDVARKLNADTRAVEMMLNALVSLDLLTKQDGLFYNTSLSKRYLMQNSPDDSRASLMHTVHLWARWSTLTECIKEGSSVTYKELDQRGDDWTEAFIAAMHKNAGARAPYVVGTIGIDGAKKVLDVGGGSGAYSIAFAKADPDLQAFVFDLPDVTRIAQRHIDEAGISDRVKTKDGNFHKDNFGAGYDIVFISAICHMNSPEENLRLLKKSYDSLESGGRVIIQDFILHDDKTSPQTGALFALNMLVGTKSGSSYSEKEYTDWLRTAGFKDIEMRKLPGPTALLIGFRK